MTPRRPPLNPRVRRAALVGLYLGCAAAVGAIGLAVAAGPGETPALPVPAPVTPDDLDFAPDLLGPGTWTVATGVPLPDGLDPARLPFLRPHAPADNPFPALQGVPAVAVRVGPDGRANAAFVGPLDPATAVADWRAAGWEVTDRTADPAGRVVRVSRGEVAAVGWVVPTAVGTYVLFTPALTGARR